MLRTQETYFEKIAVRAQGTQTGIKTSIGLFFSYCMEKGIGDPLLFMKKSEENCFDLLQGWINFKTKNGMSAGAVKQNFSNLKGFLYYMGVKITKEDVKANLAFPTQIKEEPFPLQLEHIHKILECTIKKKAYYLALLSSGMRMGEALQLRKKNFDLTKARIMIKIPAKITKTKTGRTTFISKEAASFLKPKMKNLEDDDLVFGSNENINYARTTEIVTLERVLNKAGLDEKYDGVNRRKITLHSFRAYFFTKAARVHDENYAHKLTGHGGYLPQYDRLTDDEKLSMYLELEPELLVYDHSRKSAEIERLKREKSELESKTEELGLHKDEFDRLKQAVNNLITEKHSSSNNYEDEIKRNRQTINYLLDEVKKLKNH